jgi:hypothetical protein
MALLVAGSELKMKVTTVANTTYDMRQHLNTNSSTHYTTVRRKGVVSHHSTYGLHRHCNRECELTFDSPVPRNLWGHTLHLVWNCILINPSVLSLLTFQVLFHCHCDSINILVSRHTCSTRILSFQN